jgi:hypothetical protein
MVDMETLTKLRRWLQGIGDQWQQDGAPPVDLVTDFPGQEVIERLRDISGQVVRMARTDLAGKGYIAQRYTVSPSGRLYAKDINLQTAPTLVKQAALNGLWEYDFSNCHFAILMQMAATHGHQCKAIKHYLANKPKVRQALATAAGITIPQIKECLLALIYGARHRAGMRMPSLRPSGWRLHSGCTRNNCSRTLRTTFCPPAGPSWPTTRAHLTAAFPMPEIEPSVAPRNPPASWPT